MASTRTAARILAAVAALPMAALLFAGSAQADDGPRGQLANRGSNAAIAGVVGSGVGGSNHGNSTTSQQVATGAGATNQENTANVTGSGHTAIQQENVRVVFAHIHDD
ncbi:hypothetical protein J7W19_16855 [Streptomyces mobaraensis NBRC 13819 = DSM 40847]|uniref:DUF320 domain-containing protein n=2 Tax=Streptomyces mobaraensis TaxID=35621 RepID=A0A5N5WBN2_STRMB|nr:hypothetical protein [Streptomyces mobaraensis]EMF00478.1 hypothetical protein H340_11115 [Streptomyces mobaraensis NBRC 13819 = DSM 40847]KAB7848535.1 hypothetical protein FRZ00_09635 [Streptomyces mobaraensis]QTT74832.1 hypothetical protein J7W19_16855 [Streptomyces mobaraensis NBRC 13819 = DSM 40847]